MLQSESLKLISDDRSLWYPLYFELNIIALILKICMLIPHLNSLEGVVLGI